MDRGAVSVVAIMWQEQEQRVHPCPWPGCWVPHEEKEQGVEMVTISDCEV